MQSLFMQNYSVEKNGMNIIKKSQLLPYIQQFLPTNPIIVEAGAFNGNDTKKLATFWPQGSIHAFEPVPAIFAILEAATHNFPNVYRYPYALSSSNGHATFYISEKPTQPNQPFQAGSLHKPTGRLSRSPVRYPNTITVPTITLDSWAEQHSINHIDFLWLDVQGHVLPILQAAQHMLVTMKLLYLEVEFIEAYEHQSLYQEIKTWLEAQGFMEIARDFENQESWFYGNVLFRRMTT
jgi:FkbM family methyltransferase